MSGARADIVIRGGTVYDGSGGAPYAADLAIVGDRVAAVGEGWTRGDEIDATGLAVAPGFVNVLSWATESLLEDGRALSDLRQGVTLEVFGEGESLGPLTDAMKEELVTQQTNIRFEIEWTTLDEYLEHLERRGVSPNVASVVGAATVRAHVLGYDDREATPAELAEMTKLVREAMAEMPPWVQEGGFAAWRARLSDREIRARVEREMSAPNDEWENLFLLAGPENIRFTAFRSDEPRPLSGRTLAEVASERGLSPAQAAMQLVVEDGSRVEAAYFLMSEENVRRQVALPWMSFCSDAGAPTAEGVFLGWRPHPRAYGSFARLLGRYVREERIVPLEEAVRRLSSLPAENLRLHQRGMLRPGYFADVVVFDPAQISDHATFEDPHRYATGVAHVLVNGTAVIRDGEHTGAFPGRVVRGPGWGDGAASRAA